jgi:hypothetical protein
MLDVTDFLHLMQELTELSQRGQLRGDKGRFAVDILQRQVPKTLVMCEMHTTDAGNGHGDILPKVKQKRSGFKNWQDLFNFVGCDWDVAEDQNLDDSIHRVFSDTMIRVYAHDGKLLLKCRGFPPAWSIEMWVSTDCIQFAHVN